MVKFGRMKNTDISQYQSLTLSSVLPLLPEWFTPCREPITGILLQQQRNHPSVGKNMKTKTKFNHKNQPIQKRTFQYELKVQTLFKKKVPVAWQLSLSVMEVGLFSAVDSLSTVVPAVSLDTLFIHSHGCPLLWWNPSICHRVKVRPRWECAFICCRTKH